MPAKDERTGPLSPVSLSSVMVGNKAMFFTMHLQAGTSGRRMIVELAPMAQTER